jgi:hypothetical protein
MPRIPTDRPTVRPNVSTDNVRDANATTATSDVQDAPAPGGLDAATEGGTVPTGDNRPSGTGATGGTSPLGTRLGAGAMRDDLFQLVPQNAPGCVGLPDVLKAAGPAAVKQLAAMIEQQTGIAPDPAVLAAVTAKPEMVANLMQFTPKQMSDGIEALNAAHTAGQIQNVKPRERLLGEHIKLDNLDLSVIDRPQGKTKQLAPGLLQGGITSDLDDTSAKRRIAMAEVFDQLAENTLKDPKDRVDVSFQGHKVTRLDSLLDAMKADGYTVEVDYRRRVANFAELLTQDPNTGKLLDVPAAVMIRTGVVDAQGKEAVVPAVHSEMILKITSPDGKPNLDAELKWYQGVTHTGFFPKGLYREPEWCGGESTQTVTGDKAFEAVELAGLQSSLINKTAEKHDLLAAGYGVIGVCNDTVAWNEQMMTGKTDVYPLLHRDALLEPELDALLSDKNYRDDKGWKALKAGIGQLPSDHQPNATSRSRAGASIPWPAGKEPLASSAHAAQTL